MRASPVFLIAVIACLAFTPVSADPDSAQATPAQATTVQPATAQPATMAAAASDPLDQIVCHIAPLKDWRWPADLAAQLKLQVLYRLFHVHLGVQQNVVYRHTVYVIKPPPTGSMLGGGRECHTQREWNQLQTQSQNGVSGFQQRSLQNMPTGTGLSAK